MYMIYPIRLTSINETLSLYLPIPEDIRPTYEKTLSTGVEIPFPYWARVWPSALALTSYLALNHHLVRHKKVLEIGAGTGLPSFSIARMAASVIISDHAPEAVELMEKNIAYLELDNVQALCLDWNSFREDIHADLILLSDVNYAPEEFAPLLDLIQRYLKEGTKIIIATPHRLTGASFLLQLSPYIRHNQVTNTEGVDISLWILSKEA